MLVLHVSLLVLSIVSHCRTIPIGLETISHDVADRRLVPSVISDGIARQVNEDAQGLRGIKEHGTVLLNRFDERHANLPRPNLSLRGERLHRKPNTSVVTVAKYHGKPVISDERVHWTRKTKDIDPKGGKPTETIVIGESDGKVYNSHSKNSRVVDETIRYADGENRLRQRGRTTGRETVTYEHREESLSILGNRRASESPKREWNDDVFEESLFDVLDPLWRRIIKRVDPTNGTVHLNVVDANGMETVRRLDVSCVRDCDWVEKIRSVDSRNGIEIETTIFRNGTRVIEKPDPKTGKPVSMILEDNEKPSGVAILSLSVDLKRCDPGSSPDDKGRCRPSADIQRGIVDHEQNIRKRRASEATRRIAKITFYGINIPIQ